MLCCASVALALVRLTAPAFNRSWQVAFQRKGDLWIANADGTHLRRLVPNGDHPYWAPDGRRLAFVRGDWVFLFDIRTGKTSRFARLPKGTAADEWSAPKMTWDPRLPYLVVASLRSKSLKVIPLPGALLEYQFDILASEWVQPTYAPAWSPSGRFIAFARAGDVWLAKADPHLSDTNNGQIGYYETANRIAALAVFNDAEAGASLTTPFWVDELAWTAGERRLVFHYQRERGSGVSQLGYLDLTPSSKDGWESFSGFKVAVNWFDTYTRLSPRICPDGKTLSFVRLENGEATLDVSDWTGRATRKLLTDAWNPDWRPQRR